MRALITADVHARKSAWLNSAISGDSEHALSEILRVALEQRVDSVFGLGDLLDGMSNRSYDIQLWSRFLDQLQENGIPFYYIRGNHDLSDPPWLDFHPNAIYIGDGEIRCINDVNVCATDYLPANRLSEFIANIEEEPAIELLLLHQAWAEYMGEITKPQGSLRDIPYVPYAFSGDLHETHVDEYIGASGQTMWFGSPGSTSMQSIAEPKDKFVLIYDNTLPTRISQVAITSRLAHVTDSLLNEDDFSVFMEEFEFTLRSLAEKATDLALASHMVKPIVQVRFHPDIEGVERRVKRQYGERAHFFWKTLPVTDKSTEERIAVITKGEAATAESLLSLELDPTEEKEAYDLALSLLQAGTEEACEMTLSAYVEAALNLTPVTQGTADARDNTKTDFAPVSDSRRTSTDL